jgi:CBS domain-containing protein
MTKDPVLVGPGTPIGELAGIMMDAHIHRIIVVDMVTLRPLGIVSSMDILAAVARIDQSPRGTEKRQGHNAPVGALS